VIWENVSDVDHTVTADAGPSAAFDSRDIPPDGKYSRRFTAQGTTSYICRVHYQMDGQVKIED
jgi:plastocyanin